MAVKKSQFMCQRCGLPVCLWLGRWKHTANSYTGRSCGKPPQVVNREVYEKEMADIVSMVKERNNG